MFTKENQHTLAKKSFIYLPSQFVLNVVLNESLNNINKGNGNKVSSVGIIVFHVEAA